MQTHGCASGNLKAANSGFKRSLLSRIFRFRVGLPVYCLCLALAGVAGRAQSVDNLLATGLFEPFGVVVDLNDNVYVTDGAHNRIVKIVEDTAVVSSLAGDANFVAGMSNGQGVTASFSDPKGIILARGGLVVADSANHLIRYVSFSGIVTNIAGVPGVAGYSDGAAATAQFSFPSGLAVDTNGNIYIADTKNNRIRMLTPGNVVSTYAGGSPTILYEPAAVAVGDSNTVWVADTRNHSVKAFTNGIVDSARIIGSNSKSGSGTNDSLFANIARFNSPRGLLWLGSSSGLLVADSGNHTLRRIYSNTNVNSYSVETLAGTPGESGLVNGALGVAKLNSPTGLGRDQVGGLLIVDSQNNAVRVLTLTAPRPAVSDPVIGWVDFQKDSSGDSVSKLVSVLAQSFNNDVNIQILAEQGVDTFFTVGPTPASALEDTIPSPSRTTGTSPSAYSDGVPESQFSLPSIASPDVDITVKAISTQDGRRPSKVVSARFQFKTSNPSIEGDNPASFVVKDGTTSSKIYYTTNGSDPTFDLAANPLSFGPVAAGTTFSYDVSGGALVFKVRAFKDNYKESEIASKTFSASNFIPNRITFGFDGGEASSQFVAAPGSWFTVPVTLTLLPSQKIYSMQFNLSVTNLSTAPAIASGNVFFQSMLLYKVPNTDPVQYATIPPQLYTNAATAIPAGLTNLVFTNSSANLLSVGWLERSGLGSTNVYPTKDQDLISFSRAHDTLFSSIDGKVIVGQYGVRVPTTANIGDKYQMQIGRPSATSDGISTDAFLEATTNGSLTVGSINALKQLTVGTNRYLAGDVAPFRWLNAGDFGDTNLLNNDVLQIFESTIYTAYAPNTNTDFFDAMDISNGTTNAAFLTPNSGNDTVINSVMLGDGVLRVDDVYVAYRRSLDGTLSNYYRIWQPNPAVPGTYIRVAELASNLFRGKPLDLSGAGSTSSSSKHIAKMSAGDPPFVTFSADSVRGGSGQTISVPIRAKITGDLPIRVLMFNVNVVGSPGAPPITNSISFTQTAALGAPAMTASQGPYDFAATWLNSQGEGVYGDTVIGTLHVPIPAGTPASAVYSVHLQNVSASPNGLGIFPQAVLDGFINLDSTQNYTFGDGIPDSWRTKYFGALNSPRAAADADPDGDGVSNASEYFNGTNPASPDAGLFTTIKPVFQGADLSIPKLNLSDWSANGMQGFVLRWTTISGRNYRLESSIDLQNWSGVATNPGSDTVQGIGGIL